MSAVRAVRSAQLADPTDGTGEARTAMPVRASPSLRWCDVRVVSGQSIGVSSIPSATITSNVRAMNEPI